MPDFCSCPPSGRTAGAAGAYAVLHGYGGIPPAEAGALFKLTAEMLHIPVTAEFGYGYNRFFRI